MNGPYAAAAPAYWRAGWRGILPLPARRKKHPPAGFTGATGTDPSYPDLQTWIDGPEGAGNIALRMPPTIIGIDVDAYDGKNGAATLAAAETRWDTLPPTWRTTSRNDGISGIRFYRVPEGLAWPHVVGDSVEIIRHAHRYAVVWPSTHPEGRTYRWINPDGITTTEIPDVDSLPALPPTWVQGLTGGHTADDTNRNTLDDTNAGIWLATLPGAQDRTCARMSRAVAGAVTELHAGTGGAHDTACAATSRIVRLGAEGHRGLVAALADVHRAFLDNITNPRRPGARRTRDEATREWRGLVTSAVNLVTAIPSTYSCDCDGALTALIVGDKPFQTAGTAALTPMPLTPPNPDPDPENETPGNDPPPDAERTSWWAPRIDTQLADAAQEPLPVLLARSDGARLFYAQRINGLLGEAESGKTWVALAAVAEALREAKPVVFLDFEDVLSGFVARLRALGAGDDELTRVRYIAPAETLHAAAVADLRDVLEESRPALVVLDGVNAAMTLLGLDLNSNTDATRFTQMLLRPLADTGAAVVYVDHVPKDRDNRGKGGIGAQAKRAMTTGCALTVEVTQEFGRGMTGRLRLTVDKDRTGHVRAVARGAKHAGVAVLTSDKATGNVRIVIEAPDMTAPDDKLRGAIAAVMEDICQFLKEMPERSSVRAVREVIHADNKIIDAALRALVDRGFVKVEAKSRHVLVRSYTIAEDVAGEYEA